MHKDYVLVKQAIPDDNVRRILKNHGKLLS
jgi:hypothetical protein